jgi:hypothetical protein
MVPTNLSCCAADAHHVGIVHEVRRTAERFAMRGVMKWVSYDEKYFYR